MWHMVADVIGTAKKHGTKQQHQNEMKIQLKILHTSFASMCSWFRPPEFSLGGRTRDIGAFGNCWDVAHYTTQCVKFI